MSTLPLIVFLERDSVQGEFHRPGTPHEYREYPSTPVEASFERLQDATVAIVNKFPMSAELIARLPNLQHIAVSATGTNTVDLAACRARGISVSNIRGYAVHAVPEHVMALTLALRRNLIAYREDVARGRWQQSAMFCFFDHPIRDLSGATMGIIGGGSLGKSVSRLAEAFGMRVLFAEHRGAAQTRSGYTAFETVLRDADVITLHCPLTDTTKNLIGEVELRAMKPEALLINTARGGLVDEAALARALKEGWIAGAGFDVLTTEPPKNGNPLLELNQPNFILTPHVAWASGGAMQRLLDQLTHNIDAWLSGQPHNLVA